MGVTGLWPLLEPAGTPIALESLEGKVVAIDISVWLHQAMRGTAAHQGNSRYAHLITLFLRIVKLLYYRIRPVFVFDGPAVPIFKKRTLTKRRLQKDVSALQLNKVQRKLLLTLAKNNSVQGLDEEGQDVQIEFKMGKAVGGNDLFQLPAGTPCFDCDSDSGSDYESDYEEINAVDGFDKPGDTSFNSDTIDFESETFQSLPIETKREILIEAQERNRESRLCSTYVAPHSDDFSKFQMNRLIERGKVNSRLDFVNKELAHQHVLTSMESLPLTGKGTINVKKIVNDGMKKQHLLLEEVPKTSDDALDVQKIDQTDLFSILKEKIYEKHIAGNEEKHKFVEDKRDMVDEFESDNNSDDEDMCIESHAHQPSWFNARPTIGLSRKETETVDIDSVDVTNRIKRNRQSVERNLEKKVLLQDLEKPCCSRDVEISDRKVADRKRSQEATVLSEVEKSKLVSVEDVFEDDFSDSGTEEFEDVSEIVIQESFQKATTDFVGIIEQSEAKIVTNFDPDKPGTSKELTSIVVSDMKDIEKLTNLESQHESQDQSLTAQMHAECQELLSLFGLPFVLAPGEAEAECAWLQSNQLVSAVVTEDSDVWLFGATQVLRYMFRKDKRVQQFTAKEIVEKLGLSRDELIVVAMLSGCDYTQGVEGIGVVAALEVISEFSEPNDQSRFLALKRFYDWWTDEQRELILEKPTGPIRARLRKLDCKFPPSFPDKGVFDAYMRPNVQESKERFSWGKPKFEEMKERYCTQFGWDHRRFDELINPVKERWLPSGAIQTHISSFLTKFTKDPKEMKLTSSKRVDLALKKLKNKAENPEELLVEEAPKITKKKKNPGDSKCPPKRKAQRRGTKNVKRKIENTKNLCLSESSDSS